VEVRDYNGVGLWSRDAIVERYRSYCRTHGIPQPTDLSPLEHTEGDVKWVYPVMNKVIPLIERGDPAAVALGVEFVEEDQFMSFGRILKANTARALRRTKLSPEQVERLRQRIIGLLLAGTIRREFREYAKLLRHIGLGHWWPELERRVDRKNPYAMRYFEYLRQHEP
jgi:hypothetical protein